MKTDQIKKNIESMKKELIAFIKNDPKKASKILQYNISSCYQFMSGIRNLAYEKIIELYKRLEKYNN